MMLGVSPGIVMAGAALALVAGGAAGAWVATTASAARVARADAARIACERDRERERHEGAQRALRLMDRAHDAERLALGRLGAARASAAEKQRTVHAEIDRLASDRQCLARGLGLRLNAFIERDLPKGASSADPAAAAPAADPDPDAGGGASEADLARWIVDAVTRYDECRARIDAIRLWDEGAAHTVTGTR